MSSPTPFFFAFRRGQARVVDACCTQSCPPYNAQDELVVTDVRIVDEERGEMIPHGYTPIRKTPTGKLIAPPICWLVLRPHSFGSLRNKCKLEE